MISVYPSAQDMPADHRFGSKRHRREHTHTPSIISAMVAFAGIAAPALPDAERGRIHLCKRHRAGGLPTVRKSGPLLTTASAATSTPAPESPASACPNDEWTQALAPGKVVEYWASGTPRLGTVTRVHATTVELLDAASPPGLRKVSHGEIVSVWQSPANARAASSAADALVESTDVRRSVLALFETRSRGARTPFLSSDAAAVLFPRSADRDAATAAAARVLGAHPARFRRAPAGSGWRAFAPSVASTRETAAFVDAARKLVGASSRETIWPAEQRAVLADVEVAAAAGAAVPRGVRRVLRELGYEPTGAGAAQLLLDVGHWAPRSTASGSAAKAPASSPPVARGGTFPPALLESARGLLQSTRASRRKLSSAPVIHPRRDMRRLAGAAFCVDERGSRFLDDAISVRLLHEGAVARVFVHVADVASLIEPGSPLDVIAAERGQTLYLPLRPLHMLPPAAMEAACFSASLPVHAVTVALDLSVDDRTLVRWDVFPSLVPAVVRVSYDQLDEIVGQPKSACGLSDEHADALRTLARIAPALAAATRQRGQKQRAALGPRAVSGVRLVRERGRGAGRVAEVAHYRAGGSHAVVSALLGAAGAVLREFARERRVPLPEGAGADAYALRCGTAPLRRYADLVVQRQVRSALFGDQPASAREMIALRARLARGAAKAADTVERARTAALLDALADRCARQKAAAKRSRAVIAGVVRNATVSRAGMLRATVDLDGAGVVADAGLSQSIADRTRARADKEAGGKEGKMARHEARMQAMRDVVRPGVKVHVEIDEVDCAAQVVRATICHIAGA